MPNLLNQLPKSRVRQFAHRMTTIALVVLPIVAGIQTHASRAAAQTVCGKRTDVISALARQHGEKPKAIGLSEGGTLVELLVSPKGGWTLLMTYPSHKTCLVATGAYWESIPTIATGPAA